MLFTWAARQKLQVTPLDQFVVTRRTNDPACSTNLRLVLSEASVAGALIDSGVCALLVLRQDTTKARLKASAIVNRHLTRQSFRAAARSTGGKPPGNSQHTLFPCSLLLRLSALLCIRHRRNNLGRLVRNLRHARQRFGRLGCRGNWLGLTPRTKVGAPFRDPRTVLELAANILLTQSLV